MPEYPSRATSAFIGKILRILITLAALAWVFHTVSFEKILLALKNTRLAFFLLAVILFQASDFIRTLRWKRLLQGAIPSISYRTLLMLNYSGSFFDIFLPTGFGGDIVKTIELNRADSKTPIVDHASLVILDRFSGFMALFTICIVALPFALPFIPRQLAFWIALIAIGGLLPAVILISNLGVKQLVKIFDRFTLTKKVSSYLGRMASITHQSLLATWLIALFFHLTIIGVHYSLSLALNSQVSMIVFFVFTPIVSLALLLPSIQGLGINENLYEYLLSQVGAPEAAGVTLGLLLFAVKVVTGLLGGIVYLYYIIAKKKDDDNDTEPSASPV
jgi:uncharacterized protein (TIRG00374 family)